ncbi:hypothetical protein GCM10009808_10060 [Microbacterium sediminicola]|uniref:AAA+ ATPase domain-containing protein n=1 Tax=Microbacterium sediminicola TaxID=415210 RepID=A0ABN2HWZ7_9MICO
MGPSDTLPIRGLVGLAKAEAKRWGALRATTTHAAAAFAQSWPAEFTQAFGPDGSLQVARLLAADKATGSEAEIRNMITASPDATDLALRLHSALRPDLLVADLLTMPDGFDGTPVAPPASTATPSSTPAPPSLLRREEALNLAARLLSAEPLIPAIIGPRGGGKTSLAAEVATLLHELPTPLPVIFFDPGSATDDEPAMLLGETLAALTQRTVVVVEDVDDLARLGTSEPDVSILREIWRAERFPLARLLVTFTAPHHERLTELYRALDDKLALAPLAPWDPEILRELVTMEARSLTERHGVAIDRAAVDSALAAPTPSDRLGHPALALSRLDVACARAVLTGAGGISGADVENP